jgi:hypothetical protein
MRMSDYDPNQGTPPPGGQEYPGMAPPPPSAPRPPAAVPQQVRLAVNLLFALVAIGAISVIVALTQTGAVADQIRQADPNLTEAQVDAAVTAGIIGGVVVGLIFTALFLWLTFMVRKGANWARMVLTVLFLIGIIFQLLGLAGPGTAIAKVISVVQIVLELVILYLLWQRPSTEYFTARRTA